jgi:hypothetical protein
MACSARAISGAMVLRPHVAIRSQFLDCAVFSGLDLAPGNLWRPTETTLAPRLGRLPPGNHDQVVDAIASCAVSGVVAIPVGRALALVVRATAGVNRTKFVAGCLGGFGIKTSIRF